MLSPARWLWKLAAGIGLGLVLLEMALSALVTPIPGVIIGGTAYAFGLAAGLLLDWYRRAQAIASLDESDATRNPPELRADSA